MIANARALDRGWVPSEVVHRNAEKNSFGRALQPLDDGAAEGRHVICTGPAGAGKTCLARVTVQKLSQRVLGLETQYINCFMDSTTYQVGVKLLDGINRAGTIHRNTPHDEFWRHLRENDAPYIVILDEADSLDDPSLIRRLYDLDGVTPIFIGSDMDGIAGRLRTNVRSRLRTGVTIRFDRYDIDTLTDILAARADVGLTPGSITPDQLRRIADAAVGNARDAIGTLYEAADRAQADSASAIRDHHIEAAIPAAKRSNRQSDLQNISARHQTVFKILSESDGLNPKTITDRYCEQADEPRSKRTIRKYLRKLEHYNLAWSDGQGPARRYYAQSFDS